MKNFFYFNSVHRNGFLFLVIIIIIVHLISSNCCYEEELPFDFSTFQIEVENLKSIQKKYQKPKVSKQFKSKKEITKIEFKKQPLLIEINSADTSDFELLPKIGPFFAKRIYKYRSLLGGFFSKQQLLEVYGLDTSRFNSFQQFTYVDVSEIKKININENSAFDLAKHPYISNKIAKSIVNYKKQHGKYQSVSDLKKLHLIDTLKFRKIAPYISVDGNTINSK